MQAEKQARDPMRQVFALAPDCDATQLKLTAAEGYLLSRIDGTTPWRLLREMSGLPVDEADSCVARWVEQGLLDVVAEAGPSTADAKPTSDPSGPGTRDRAEDSAPPAPGPDAARAEPGARSVPVIDENLLDDRLDIGLDVQRRILEFEACLGRPYHELLGVPREAEPKVVKRAYFKLSKEFHPDRYFRRQIGDHAERLERIFKKVLEAHEMLSDPDLREVANQADPAESAAAPASDASSQPASDGAASAKPRPLSKLERLRQRMPFKIDHAALAARREKAQEIFRAAELSQRAGRLAEAEASIRIAISFDPARAEFKEALGSLRLEAAGARATKLLATSSDRMSDGELRDALKLLEDVLMYRPHDPELNDRAARVCIQLGKFDAARGYVETLIERTPEVAAYHSLLGRIYREQEDTDAAVAAFETALKLDENDVDARRALAAVRLGARNVARGGKR